MSSVETQAATAAPPASVADTKRAREPLFTRAFIVLFCFSFVTFFGAFQFLPAMPLRILDLHGTEAQAGWFLGAFTFASASFSPLMGSIADRFGRRRYLIIGSVLFVGFAALYSIIHSVPVLVVTGAIQGAVWSGLLAASGALMSDAVPVSRRAEGLSYWGIASCGAIAVSPIIGLKVYSFSWNILCLEAGLLAVGMIIAAIAQREKPHNRVTGWQGLVSAGILDKNVFMVALSLFMVSFGYGAMTSYIALYCRAAHVKPESIYFTVFATTIILARPALGRVADSIGHVKILLPSLAVAAIGLAILALKPSMVTIVTSALVFGLGYGCAYPAFVAHMLGLTDPARRAQTFGSIVAAFDTGIGLGSILLGAVVAKYGFQSAFGLAAVIAMFSIPTFLTTERIMRKNKARAA